MHLEMGLQACGFLSVERRVPDATDTDDVSTLVYSFFMGLGL